MQELSRRLLELKLQLVTLNGYCLEQENGVDGLDDLTERICSCFQREVSGRDWALACRQIQSARSAITPNEKLFRLNSALDLGIMSIQRLTAAGTNI